MDLIKIIISMFLIWIIVLKFSPKENFNIAGPQGPVGYIDTMGQVIIPAKFEDAKSFSNNLAAVKYRGKWGYINKSGEFIIAPQFTTADNFYSGYAKVGSFKYVDTLGNITNEYPYDQSYKYNEKLNPFSEEDFWERKRYGYKDSLRNIIIKPQFEKAESFHEGMAVVKKKDKYGYIDEKGKMIIKNKYDDATPFWNGFASVGLIKNPDSYRSSFEWGFVNKEGQNITEIKFSTVYPYYYRKALVEENEKWSFINYKGEYINKDLYDDHNSSYTNMHAVKTNDVWGLLDEEYNMLFDTIYSGVKILNLDLVALKNGDKWMLYNKEGEILNPLSFDKISKISTDLFIVEFDEIKGVVDDSGKMIFQGKFDRIEKLGAIYADLYLVTNHVDSKTEYRVFNGNGNLILPMNHSRPQGLMHGIVFNKNDLKGYMKEEGDIMIPPKYDKIERLQSSGLIKASFDDSYHIYLSSGRILDLSSVRKVVDNRIEDGLVAVEFNKYGKLANTKDSELSEKPKEKEDKYKLILKNNNSFNLDTPFVQSYIIFDTLYLLNNSEFDLNNLNIKLNPTYNSFDDMLWDFFLPTYCYQSSYLKVPKKSNLKIPLFEFKHSKTGSSFNNFDGTVINWNVSTDIKYQNHTLRYESFFH